MINCPNCGAPLSGYVCEYCGSAVENKAYNYISWQDQNLANQLEMARADCLNQLQTERILNSLRRYESGLQLG